MEFRLLRADEIDVRVSMVNKYGVGLLLYKDARCDQNILDETVGAMNWQRHHSRDNANCIVSIWDDEKKQWIEKEDTGTESYTEKEKGLASDSFKRACFNWGIGRELYTAPDMWVKPNYLKKFEGSGDRYTCKDRFRVLDIEYSGRKITRVIISDDTSEQEIEFGEPATVAEKKEETLKKPIGKIKAKALAKKCEDKGVDLQKLFDRYNVEKLEDLTEEQHLRALKGLEKT